MPSSTEEQQDEHPPNPPTSLEDHLRNLILRNQPTVPQYLPPSFTNEPLNLMAEHSSPIPAAYKNIHRNESTPFSPQHQLQAVQTPPWSQSAHLNQQQLNTLPPFEVQTVGGLYASATPTPHGPRPADQADIPLRLRASQAHGRNNRNTPPPVNHAHFPALGYQPPKPLSPPRKYTPQNVPSQSANQRPRYQPLKLQQHSIQPNARYAGLKNRPSPAQRALVPLEQLAAEQAPALAALANRIIRDEIAGERETALKNELLAKLRDICAHIFPGSSLVPFGSFVTGFTTSSSDLDVVITLGDVAYRTNDATSPSLILEDGSDSTPVMLEMTLRQAGFDVQLLTRTRVPIIKLVQKPVADGDPELQCDIGFNNKLAIHNTHLLLTYSRYDVRVKQLAVFVKWWAKKRRINSPYRGTLSSYGYVLMVLHYLINVVTPPVVQNLQLLPPAQGTNEEEIIYMGATGQYNIWFSKDIENLKPSANQMSIGTLIWGFFDYYAFKFLWGQSVISIRTRGGLLSKQEKGWVAAVSRPGTDRAGENWEVKDRYLFAVEDPFETHHNVARTCNGPGVLRIRDELRRAMRLIRCRDGGKSMMEYLCIEAPPDKPFVRREDRFSASQRPNGPDPKINNKPEDPVPFTSKSLEGKPDVGNTPAPPNEQATSTQPQI